MPDLTPAERFVNVAAQLWCLPQHQHKVMDAEFAYSIVEALRAAFAQGMQVGAERRREQDEMLHSEIDPRCDHERQEGSPGAAAMGAILRYRDTIRATPLREETP
mgnify:CR=1 FL=1